MTDTIPLGNGPGPIAAGEAAIWVANSRDGTVSRIDPATRSVEAEIPVGRLPVRHRGRRRRGVGGEQPLRDRVAHRPAHEPRHEDDRRSEGRPIRSRSPAAGCGSASSRPRRVRRPPAGRRWRACCSSRTPGRAIRPGSANAQLLHAICARLMTYASRSGSGARNSCPSSPRRRPRCPAAGASTRSRSAPDTASRRHPAEPVTAAAFQRAIERALNRAHEFRAALAFVDDVVGAAAYRAGRAGTVAGVSARGDRLTIRLTRPSPTLPARMATFYFCAVPPNTPIRPRGLDRVATAGPYYVAEVAPRKRLVLRRNPGYPGPRPQRLEAIEVTIGTPPDRAVAEVEAGRADYVAERAARRPGAADRALRARTAAPRRRAGSGTSRDRSRSWGACCSIRAGRCSPGPRCGGRSTTRSTAARWRACGLAGRPTDQHMPPGWPGFRDATIYPLGGPDLATARRLAGGGRRRGVLYTCNCPDCLERAEIVRENLAAIGIELEIRRFSSARCSRGVTKPDEPFDLSLFGWVGDVPDPSAIHRRHVQRTAATHGVPRAHAAGTADTRREPARRRRADRGLRRPGPRHRGAGGAVRRRSSARCARTSSPRASAARSSIRSTASTSRRSACGSRATMV